MNVEHYPIDDHDWNLIFDDKYDDLPILEHRLSQWHLVIFDFKLIDLDIGGYRLKLDVEKWLDTHIQKPSYDYVINANFGGIAMFLHSEDANFFKLTWC